MRITGLDEVQRNLEKWHNGVTRQVARAMEEIGALLENYAKQNHPWSDRTSNTTNSIRGFISKATPLMIQTTLSAGMDYDVFLELARDGKWAWLWPAIEANMDEIKRKLDSVVEV